MRPPSRPHVETADERGTDGVGTSPRADGSRFFVPRPSVAAVHMDPRPGPPRVLCVNSRCLDPTPDAGANDAAGSGV
jgi:hypothetical protein